LPESQNIINNDLNVSAVKQEAISVDETSSINNNLTSNINNNTNLNTNNINTTNINNQNANQNQNIENDFSHIPIKICLIGHSFSGRKTQAKLLCEKYPKLKYYSLENVINNYFSEYERLHTPIENNPKQKNAKKNQLEQLKAQRLEELKQYEYIFSILEPFVKDNKKDRDLSDEAKINIFIDLIKKDFPMKEGDIYEEIAKRNLRKQTIEQDLERMKEESEKKKKFGPKEIREQQLLEKEYDDLTKEGYYGFILVDFPNNYSQYIKFENTLTGFVQQIDKEENMRDKYLDLLTFSIDKPYTNISNLCPDVINYLGFGNKNLSNSFFNNYIWLEIDEEETLKRVNDRLIDETTNIIYHKDFNPPPQNDKKIMERLKPVTEPTEEEIKNELKKYDIEFPKILGYISLFHNLKRISKVNKNEIFEEIDEILLNVVKKFEDREIKDEIVALNNYDLDEEENIKYFKKLNEVKKKVNKEISGSIISLWSETSYNYSKSVKKFLYNLSLLKSNILEKMDMMQQIFIKYLNNRSQKRKLVEIFQKKYEVFIEKYNYLKKKDIVKEEFQKDVVELTEHFWEMIQMKKRDAINELKSLKDQNFIDNQFETFWKYISDLFIAETNFYIKKINIIRKYYYEFEGSRYSEKCPYIYSFDEQDILKDINSFIIFNKNYKKGNKDKDRDINTENKNNKKDNNNTKEKDKENLNNNNNIDFQSEEISPRIDKMFKNCFKFLFYYDKKINEIIQKEKEKFALNISGITKRKHRKKNIMDGKSEPSIFSESKTLISYETEMRAALNNEKIKYKIRISLLKFFSEKFLVEAYDISDQTFENIDKSIIKSVDAQNVAMNELMSKIRKDIKEGRNKIEYNIELDVFDIYKKLTIPFKEFILSLYNNLDKKEKQVNINELNKIYLDLKNYEIQDNYVTINSVIDIVFKKHLFEFQSNAFIKYLKELPYHYLNNLIKKFIYKTSGGQSLVRIDRLFTILAIINFSPPKSSQKKEILESVSDKLKFHCFLSKEDFSNTVLWFEAEEKNDNVILNFNSSPNVNNNFISIKSNKTNQKLNLVDISSNKNEIIAEEYTERHNEIDDINNDINNDIIIPENDDININSETRQQMNTLFKNLTTKTPYRMKSRRTSKKITKISSSPVKLVSDEIKLKDFLFKINKNIDNQINFIDFMNVTSLHFIKNKSKKSKANKNINVNLLLKWAKSGELPKPSKNNYYRKSTNLAGNEIVSLPKKKDPHQDNYHRSTSIHITDKNGIYPNKVKSEKTYLGGDSEYSISKEDDFIYINNKKFSQDSFKENIYIETTYLDELIEDNPQ
jgi:adenylate kinase family enzyme